MNFILIHGACGSPQENWLPWLKKVLEDENHRVFAPKFPTPQNQTPAAWLDVLNQYPIKYDQRLILIGHSIGGALILHKLQRIRTKIKAVYLVAGFIGKLGLPQFDPLNAPFFSNPFDWDSIRSSSDSFTIYGSRDDPYVLPKKTKELAEFLRVEPIFISNAGHFNQASGYTTFPQLLEDIQQIV